MADGFPNKPDVIPIPGPGTTSKKQASSNRPSYGSQLIASPMHDVLRFLAMVLCFNTQPTRVQLGTLFDSPRSPVRSASAAAVGEWDRQQHPPCLTQSLFTHMEDPSQPMKKLPFVSAGVGEGCRQAKGGHGRLEERGPPEVIRRECLDASSNQIAGSRTARGLWPAGNPLILH